ncbi:hypothetical protein GC174_08685 [bacterium]|nr:hypothetical protein [bacterium]
MNRTKYVVLVRHGESTANVALKENKNPWFYSLTGSDRQVDLTETGRLEAIKSANLIKALDIQFKQLYVSEFKRVQATAKVFQSICPDRHRICKLDPRLNKRSYGLFWNLTYEGVRVFYPEEYRHFLHQGKFLYRPPNGENYPDLLNRVGSFVQDAVKADRKNQIIFTSSAVIVAFLALFGTISISKMIPMYENNHIENGAVLVFEYIEAVDRFKLLLSFSPGNERALFN